MFVTRDKPLVYFAVFWVSNTKIHWKQISLMLCFVFLSLLFIKLPQTLFFIVYCYYWWLRIVSLAVAFFVFILLRFGDMFMFTKSCISIDNRKKWVLSTINFSEHPIVLLILVWMNNMYSFAPILYYYMLYVIWNDHFFACRC